MKKFALVLIAIFTITVSSALSLSSFMYSGVAMNAAGQIMTNTEVNVKITINDGETLYEEYHYMVMVDEFGIFVVSVGDGDSEGSFSDIFMKPLTTIRVGVSSGEDYITVEGQALISVYKRSFEGRLYKGVRSSLQQSYMGGNEIDISMPSESSYVERPVIIRNPNTHPNLILNNENESEGQTWANALTIQRGSTVLSTYHADGECCSTDDLSELGFASVIFIDQDIYSMPYGQAGQILYLVNTLPLDWENNLWVMYDPDSESSVLIEPGKMMTFVSDGNKWYPVSMFGGY
jgi:hypothetical protein